MPAQAVDDATVGHEREALGRDGGAGDIAAQMLEAFALAGVSQVINWVTPEGGCGPNYTNL